MSDKSAIQWLEGGATWSPVVGCKRCSHGCRRCYAVRMATRLASIDGQKEKYGGLVRNGDWTGEISSEEVFRFEIEKPLHWKKPRKIFVVSMGDLWYDDIPFEFIDAVMAVAVRAWWHTFIFLTKRASRMAYYMDLRTKDPNPIPAAAAEFLGDEIACDVANLISGASVPHVCFPPKNALFGVTVCNQEEYGRNVPFLLTVRNAKKWLSIEPLLGLIIPSHIYMIDWVVVGGESGPGSVSVSEEDVEAIANVCAMEGVPFWFKQWGGKDKSDIFHGRQYHQFPVMEKLCQH